ncbi:MAG TPA: hypothetical protein V6C81_20080 [Planktothrix sp.]|jgi:hypothetical protein
MSENEKIDPLALVAKMAEAERKFATSTFVAPVVSGGRVRVRLQGIVYELEVQDDFSGWAVLQMTSPGRAKVVDRPSPAVIDKYLKLCPRIKLVLVTQFENRWWALAASTEDTRIKLEGPVPVQLVERTSRFDTINARFDGSTFWFESVDRRRDPAIAKTLNKALADKVQPNDLRCSGVVPQERIAYRMVFLAEYGDDAIIAADDTTRINSALKHAGAQMQSFWYSGRDAATVRFSVAGDTHTVTVRPSDLMVLSAGVCLSGRDNDFDLTSMVGVFRELAEDGY